MNMSLFSHFIYSFIATIGYSIFFNVPKKQIPFCGLIGAIGWMTYKILNGSSFFNPVFSNFVAAFVVTLASEKLARILKKPAILFVIPGIIPLVPGAGLYNTMLSFVQENHNLAISTGIETTLISGAIALGVMVTTSIYNSIRMHKVKLRNQSNKNKTKNKQ